GAAARAGRRARVPARLARRRPARAASRGNRVGAVRRGRRAGRQAAGRRPGGPPLLGAGAGVARRSRRSGLSRHGGRPARRGSALDPRGAPRAGPRYIIGIGQADMFTGIVSAVGRVAREGDAWIYDLRVPRAVRETSIPHGAITLDGVSLTINDLPGPDSVQIALIPFTREHTTLGTLRVGDRVHVEGDVLGKYVRQLCRTAT